jgi:hypothetical protein
MGAGMDYSLECEWKKLFERLMGRIGELQELSRRVRKKFE